jgi:hypothetical protein
LILRGQKHTTPESVEVYFQNLEQAIEKYVLEDRSELIFNLDETCISPEHRQPNVIAPTGTRCLKQVGRIQPVSKTIWKIIC